MRAAQHLNIGSKRSKRITVAHVLSKQGDRQSEGEAAGIMGFMRRRDHCPSGIERYEIHVFV
jgi:hypothetical protein